ncbi:MAG: hypothetical protein O7C59_06495, partial [Rickettsia endosymbiont of Ixodes persulcatus]|nr:hypothetical protein [Rickettsia endosymbiont of Ixodes persulcatus]
EKVLKYIDVHRGNLDKYKLWCNTCSLLCDKPTHHIAMHELFFNHMIQPYDQNIKICRVCLVGTKSTSLNSHLKSYQHRILSLRAASIDDPFAQNRANLLSRATEFQKAEQVRMASLIPPQPGQSPRSALLQQAPIEPYGSLSVLDLQQFHQSWAKLAPPMAMMGVNGGGSVGGSSHDVSTQTEKPKVAHVNVSTQTNLPPQSHSVLVYSKHPKVEPIALVDSLHPDSAEYKLIPKDLAGTKQLYKYFCLSCLTFVPEAKHHRSTHESYWSLVEGYINQQERLLKYDRSTLGALEKGNNNPFNIDITKFVGNDRVRICHPCLLGVKRSGFAAHITSPAHIKRLHIFSLAGHHQEGEEVQEQGQLLQQIEEGQGGIQIEVISTDEESGNESDPIEGIISTGVGVGAHLINGDLQTQDKITAVVNDDGFDVVVGVIVVEVVVDVVIVVVVESK